MEGSWGRSGAESSEWSLALAECSRACLSHRLGARKASTPATPDAFLQQMSRFNVEVSGNELRGDLVRQGIDD